MKIEIKSLIFGVVCFGRFVDTCDEWRSHQESFHNRDREVQFEMKCKVSPVGSRKTPSGINNNHCKFKMKKSSVPLQAQTKQVVKTRRWCPVYFILFFSQQTFKNRTVSSLAAGLIRKRLWCITCQLL